MKTTLFLLIFLCIAISSQAQINIQYSGSLKELLVLFRQKYGYKFMYSNDDIDDNQKITLNITETDIKYALEKVFRQIGIACEIKGTQVILKSEKPVKPDVTGLLPTEILTAPTVGTFPVSRQMEPVKTLKALEPAILAPPDILKTLSVSQWIQANAKMVNEPNRNEILIADNPDGKVKSKSSLAVRNDFLFDLILTPNLGVEYRPVASVGMILNGYWTHLDWNNGDKTYRLWTVNPEIRFYMTDRKRIYAGVMFQKGEFNLKLDETGRQGYFTGGGATMGYLVNLKGRLQLDFGIGLGYIRYQYDTYQYVDGLNVRTAADIKNWWWGPVKIGITLVWKIM